MQCYLVTEIPTYIGFYRFWISFIGIYFNKHNVGFVVFHLRHKPFNQILVVIISFICYIWYILIKPKIAQTVYMNIGLLLILDIEFVILIYQSNLTFYRNTMSPSSTSRVDNRKDLKMITSLWSSFVRVIVG